MDTRTTPPSKENEISSNSIVTLPNISSLQIRLRLFNLLVLNQLLNAFPAVKVLSIDTLTFNEEYIRAPFWTLVLQQQVPLLERIKLVVRGFFTVPTDKVPLPKGRTLIDGYKYDRYWIDRVQKKIFQCYENSSSLVLQIR